MDAESRQQFQEDGFVIVKNVLPKDVVSSAIQGASKLVDALAEKMVKIGRLPCTFQGEPFERRLVKMAEGNDEYMPSLFRKELHLPEFFHLFCNPHLLKIVADLLPEQESIRIFPNYSVRPKLPKFGAHEVVWHQDAGLNADGSPNEAPVEERLEAFGPGRVVNCWTPLVKATRQNGAMFAIPGSHRMGIQRHVTLRRYRESAEADKDVDYSLYAAQVDPDVMDKIHDSAVTLECDPGDVIFFSNLLIHRGGFNGSDGVRWSIDWRYQDAAKATHRAENGHIVWPPGAADAVQSPQHWASLALT